MGQFLQTGTKENDTKPPTQAKQKADLTFCLFVKLKARKGSSSSLMC